MKFELEYLDKLAKLLNENDLSEITIEDGDEIVELKRERNNALLPINKPETQPVLPCQQSENRIAITSPMVGTFYSSSSPDKAPYVQVGDFVKKNQVVCIIEAMKLLNEVEAETSGEIVEICVENGQTVEFGQVLMYLE